MSEDIYADLNKRMNSYIKTEVKEVVNSSKTNVAPQCLPTSTSINKPVMLNTFVKWKLPCELCPSCMARIRGAEPEIFSAFTSVAKGTKKAPKRVVKVKKEAKLDEEEVI